MAENPEEWQEEWRFHLDQENEKIKTETRGYLQFGGRLSLKDHFIPRANDVCKEHGLSLLKIDDFSATVDLNKDEYTVRALVTLKRNPAHAANKRSSETEPS
jgi:hypothetical protein